MPNRTEFTDERKADLLRRARENPTHPDSILILRNFDSQSLPTVSERDQLKKDYKADVAIQRADKPQPTIKERLMNIAGRSTFTA